jgi:hypothetical protein
MTIFLLQQHDDVHYNKLNFKIKKKTLTMTNLSYNINC